MTTDGTEPEARRRGVPDDGKSTRCYPLNLPSAPISRYEPLRLTERDIMAHRIMANYMNPLRSASQNPDKSSESLRDIQLLSRFVFTFGSDAYSEIGGPSLPIYLDNPSSLCPPSPLPELDTVMRYYIENDDSAMRAWIAETGCCSSVRNASIPKERIPARSRLSNRLPDLGADEKAQVDRYRSQIAIQDEHRLYAGGVFSSSVRRGLDERDIGVRRSPRIITSTDIAPFPRCWDSAPVRPEPDRWLRYMLIPWWYERYFLEWHIWGSSKCIKDFDTDPGRGRNRDGHWSTGRASPSATADGRYGRKRRRCTSLPPPGSFASARLPISSLMPTAGVTILLFPRMKLSQLDRRSRRRSLSRTRIEELFDWDVKVPNLRDQPPANSGSRCQNCLSPNHHHKVCLSPCGHCGVMSRPRAAVLQKEYHVYDGIPHAAPECPVAPHNRCKCAPFPTYHTAKNCRVTCHRDCGNPATPGTSRHWNAMLCRSRCCMCGIRGHCGKDCTNKKCRCGGRHLGQDCCWNPTCRVRGCDRYLCGVHCRECGSEERPFKDRQCWRCHGADGPFPFTKERRKKDRKTNGKATSDGDEEHTAEGQAEETGDERTAAVPAPDEGTAAAAPTNSIFGNPGWSFLGATNGENV